MTRLSNFSETNNSVRFVPFAIDRNTGVVTLTASLDREKKDVHHVTVIAYVNESPEIAAYTQVIIKYTTAFFFSKI